MLRYEDDPDLFEFNQCDEYAELNAYEPTPGPGNWKANE